MTQCAIPVTSFLLPLLARARHSIALILVFNVWTKTRALAASRWRNCADSDFSRHLQSHDPIQIQLSSQFVTSYVYPTSVMCVHHVSYISFYCVCILNYAQPRIKQIVGNKWSGVIITRRCESRRESRRSVFSERAASNKAQLPSRRWSGVTAD